MTTHLKLSTFSLGGRQGPKFCIGLLQRFVLSKSFNSWPFCWYFCSLGRSPFEALGWQFHHHLTNGHLQNCQDHHSRRCGYSSLELRFAIFFQNLVSWSHDCSSKFKDLGFSQWTWGNDRIWSVYFSNGRLNHQLVPYMSKTTKIACPVHFTPHSTWGKSPWISHMPKKSGRMKFSGFTLLKSRLDILKGETSS